MCRSKELCPVPFDQQPLNEYIALKKSCFFSWSILSIDKYVSTICNIFFILFLLLGPFIWIIVYSYANMCKVVFFDVFVVTCIFVFIFTRLYLGWSYIIKRLISATVLYEESGWYDGQIWIKTVDSLTKDRLIGLYELYPFISRIKYSLLISIILCVLEIFVVYLI